MFLFYIIIPIIVTDLLMIFYRGSCMYCHILQILKRIGFKSKDPDWWKYYFSITEEDVVELKVEDFTQEDAIAFIKSKNSFIGELISCHYCISWHFSFWVSLLVSVIFLCFGGLFIDSLVVFVFGFFSSPLISNLLLKKL